MMNILKVISGVAGIFDLSRAPQNKISNIHSFSVKDIKLNEVSLANYKGKVLMIVNAASKCGFTKQYNALQKVYDKYPTPVAWCAMHLYGNPNLKVE